MEETASLIDGLIREHSQIKESMQTYEQSISDLGQARDLEGAKDRFVPGRLGDQRQGVTQLERDLMTIDSKLEHHFYREEKALLQAFERHGLPELASLLRVLLTEHEHIRGRLATLKESAAELVGGKLSQSLWNAKAWDLRATIGHTRQEVEGHALKEDVLFQDAKKALQGKAV